MAIGLKGAAAILQGALYVISERAVLFQVGGVLEVVMLVLSSLGQWIQHGVFAANAHQVRVEGVYVSSASGV